MVVVVLAVGRVRPRCLAVFLLRAVFDSAVYDRILPRATGHLRDDLVDMGEVFNDDSILDIVLEGLTDEYLQI